MDWRDQVASVAGAAVVEAEVLQSLWGGYGQLLRVRLDGPPGRLIVKRVTPPAGRGVGHERKLRSYEVEAAFYRLYAGRSEARTARAWHAARDGETWLLVLEDLDAAGYAGRRGYGADLEPRAIVACLRWLARFHASFLDRAPEALWREGGYWHLATRPDELAAMAPGPLRDHAEVWDAALRHARHRTLLHGDAKPANFCFGEGDVAAVDFQYVGAGVGVKDVAYFLGGALREPRLSQQAARWRERYFAALRRAVAQRGHDATAVESEWRGLWSVAWADFERFLAGWRPTYWKRSAYARRMVERSLERYGRS